ncbi:MAG: hypothetical protein BZ137_01340 [Methanosphaera sp. rholeuAM130]|nr:MAG: hypothetical protein BZ137_01340 [Methanosphaera sp. rholeuAM130]
MISINLNDDDIKITDKYKLIVNTTRKKDKNGNLKEYHAYSCSFPYPFIEFFSKPDGIYFYERRDKYYITTKEPPNYYLYKYVSLNNRKNSNQNSSKENKDKKWAKLVKIPKTVMGEMNKSMELLYEFHLDKKDYVTGKQGLLEVSLLQNSI